MVIFLSHYLWLDYSHSNVNIKIDTAIRGNKVRAKSVLLSFIHLKLNLSNISLVKEKMKVLGPDQKLFDCICLSLVLFTAANITSHYTAGKQEFLLNLGAL